MPTDLFMCRTGCLQRTAEIHFLITPSFPTSFPHPDDLQATARSGQTMFEHLGWTVIAENLTFLWTD